MPGDVPALQKCHLKIEKNKKTKKRNLYDWETTGIVGSFAKCFLLCLFLTQVVFVFFFLYLYYKNKIFLTQLVKKVIINKEHNYLHDNNKHNWQGTRGESLS